MIEALTVEITKWKLRKGEFPTFQVRGYLWRPVSWHQEHIGLYSRVNYIQGFLFVSYSSRNKSPQTWWPKTTLVCSFVVLESEAGDQFLWVQGQVSAVRLPAEARVGRGPALPRLSHSQSCSPLSTLPPSSKAAKLHLKSPAFFSVLTLPSALHSGIPRCLLLPGHVWLQVLKNKLVVINTLLTNNTEKLIFCR